MVGLQGTHGIRHTLKYAQYSNKSVNDIHNPNRAIHPGIDRGYGQDSVRQRVSALFSFSLPTSVTIGESDLITYLRKQKGNYRNPVDLIITS